MSNQLRVYTQVLKTLKRMMPSQTQGHVATLAMMITGIVIGKKAQLAPMSTEVPHPAKDKSIEKRMRRWVKNGRVEIEVYFLPYAQALLAGLAENTLRTRKVAAFRSTKAISPTRRAWHACSSPPAWPTSG